MERFTKFVTTPLGVVAAIMVGLLMMLTIVDVTTRKFTGQGVAGAVEYTEVFLVVGVFAAMGIAQSTGTHVTTSILTSRLSPRVRRIVRLVGAVIGLVVVFVMVGVAAVEAWRSFQVGEFRFGLARVAIWPAKAAIAVGLFVFAVEYLRTTIRQARNPQEGVSLIEGVEGLEGLDRSSAVDDAPESGAAR